MGAGVVQLGMVELNVSDEKLDRFLEFIVDLLFIEWQTENAEAESAKPEARGENEADGAGENGSQ